MHTKKRKPCILLACLMALVLAVGGCTGFKKFIGMAAEKVCGFSVAESQEAQMAMDFVSNMAPVVGALVGVPVNQAQAEAILNQVTIAAQTGGCVLLTDLKAAMDYFDALVAEYSAQADKAKYKALFPVVKVPSVMRLRAKVAEK